MLAAPKRKCAARAQEEQVEAAHCWPDDALSTHTRRSPKPTAGRSRPPSLHLRANHKLLCLRMMQEAPGLEGKRRLVAELDGEALGECSNGVGRPQSPLPLDGSVASLRRCPLLRRPSPTRAALQKPPFIQTVGLLSLRFSALTQERI